MEKKVFPIPHIPFIFVHGGAVLLMGCWFHHTLVMVLVLWSSSDVSSHVRTNYLTSPSHDPPLLTLLQQQQQQQNLYNICCLSFTCFLHVHFFQQLENNNFVLGL
jgi:hypothetical protein